MGHPECRTEQVQSCPDDNREEITNFVNVDRKCVKVDVTRCNIVKKTLRKAKPVHQCKRDPKNRVICHQEEYVSNSQEHLAPAGNYGESVAVKTCCHPIQMLPCHKLDII